MAEKTAEKPSGKLLLFNHSRNPFHLKPAPVKEGETPVKRVWPVGAPLECIDQAEYDQMKQYKGVGTTQQVAPTLQAAVIRLEQEKAALLDEKADLLKQLEKFQSKGK